MVLLIKELVGNRSFPLKADGNKRNRLRRLKNDVPQGSVLAPLLFNIYTSDLPIIVTRKYAHADDLAIMHEGGNWQAVDECSAKTIVKYSRPGSSALQKQCRQITNGMRSGRRAIRDSVLSFPTSALPLLKWPCQEQGGSGLTASALVSDVSAPACTNGVCGL